MLLVGDVTSVHLQRWAVALADDGWRVMAAGFGPVDLPGVETLDLGGSGPRRTRYVTAMPRLAGALRRFDPAVVNAHYVASFGAMAQLTAGSRPVVQTVWGSDLLLRGVRRALVPVVWQALVRAAAVTVDSDEVGCIATRLAPLVPLTYVPFGPERSWCESPRTPAPLVFSPRGAGEPYNVDQVITAFGIITDRPGWTLEVATGGVPLPQTAPTQSRTVSLPRMTRTEMQRCFLRAEIFCSVPSTDGGSASVLEGMAAGSFPIVSDLPSNRQWIADGENGLVVPACDAQALAKAIRRAIDDEGLRKAACAANRARVAAELSWEASVDRMSGVLHLAAAS